LFASAAAFVLTAPATARADDTYAAIAFSAKTGDVSFNVGVQFSREKAEHSALANCKGDDARVVGWVKNGWCAVAIGRNNLYAIGSDKDRDTARRNAILEYIQFNSNSNDGFQGFIRGIWSGTATSTASFEELVRSPLTPMELEIIRLTNVERKKAKVPELVRNDKLAAGAAKYAAVMAQKDMLSDDLDGTLRDRLNAYGYRPLAYAENRSAGEDDKAEVVRAWMADPLHRANLLSPNYTEIGVGMAKTANGKVYICQDFGKPQ